MRYRKGSLSILVFCWYTACFAQYQIPEKPKLQTSVYDYINLLPEGQEKTLEQKLIRYSDSTSTQIVIAIIRSTEGEEDQLFGGPMGSKMGHWASWKG